MADQATPNLPSRDFDVTEQFFAELGFDRSYRDHNWMILKRGSLVLEFFLYEGLDPATSAFSCCLRLEDVDGFYRLCQRAGIPERNTGWPRLMAPKSQPWGGRMGYLVDPDCTLVRLIQN
ncbi:bleomycin resistance protein [uncultured Devosia sp.]|uniref:bleomycin resistance protein n=1 Tax=uncultured Devosia sp. TaxID=211434 RepID=UPI0026034A6E|nr:bleomycin resistance protein [uncultured Devosia sp.]